MDLKIITEVYHEVFNDDLSLFVNAAKAIACTIILIDLTKKLSVNFTTKGEVVGEQENSFSPAQILRSGGLLIAAIFITQFLTALDNLFVPLGDLVKTTYSKELAANAYTNLDITAADTGNTVADLAIDYIRQIKESMNGGEGITTRLLWMIDNSLYAYALAKRFFFMGIVKILAPLIIALSILEKFKEFNTNLIKIYIRSLLSLIPILLVMVFSVKCYEVYVNQMYNWGGAVQGTATMVLAGNTIKSAGLLLLVILKFSLFRTCNEIMKNLIP